MGRKSFIRKTKNIAEKLAGLDRSKVITLSGNTVNNRHNSN